MVAMLDSNPITPRPRPNLLLHCGARAVERKQVQLVPTPRATDTHVGIHSLS